MKSHLDPQNISAETHARIGLLGGSFNPAHKAHRAMSDYAMQKFGLDAIWWLVSPQNPLKLPGQLKPYAERYQNALTAAQNVQGLVATDMEARLGLIYSIDLLRHLRKNYPKIQWLWLMGADNMVHFHYWKEWEEIFRQVPMAVFRRPPYTGMIRQSPAYQLFCGAEVLPTEPEKLFTGYLPAWTLADNVEIDLSSTEVREGSKQAW